MGPELEFGVSRDGMLVDEGQGIGSEDTWTVAETEGSSDSVQDEGCTHVTVDSSIEIAQCLGKYSTKSCKILPSRTSEEYTIAIIKRPRKFIEINSFITFIIGNYGLRFGRILRMRN